MSDHSLFFVPFYRQSVKYMLKTRKMFGYIQTFAYLCSSFKNQIIITLALRSTVKRKFMKKSYDVIFNDDTSSNEKGWKETKEYCLNYIEEYNGTDESYFEDYKGGIVQIVCNETGQVVFEDRVR